MDDDSDTSTPDMVREVVDRSRSGAPAAGMVVRDRFSTDEIFQRIVAAADEEITSTRRELFFSGLAAGFAITITFLMYASGTEATGWDPILSQLLYPLGFIYIILGTSCTLRTRYPRSRWCSNGSSVSPNCSESG